MPKLLFLLALLTIDQLTKYFTPSTICNPYISWSIPLHGIFLWILIIASLFLLIYTLKKNAFSYPLLLIAAGAIGNIIDRLHSGCVIDFISISTIPLIDKISFLVTFPTFNLADTFITLGAILFLWQEFKKR